MSRVLLHMLHRPIVPGAPTAQQLERAAEGELHPTRHSRVRGKRAPLSLTLGGSIAITVSLRVFCLSLGGCDVDCTLQRRLRPRLFFLRTSYVFMRLKLYVSQNLLALTAVDGEG